MIVKAAFSIFILAALMIGAQLYQSDQEYEVTRDIYNFTEEKIDIPPSIISSLHPIERTKGLINIGRFYKILESGINFLYIGAEETMKMGIEYGYQNPKINWEKVLKLVMLVLIVWVVTMLIKPLGYFFVFTIMLIMMLRDKLKKRKKRKKDGNN